MVQYDSKIIRDFAEGLYKQAKATPAIHFFIGLAVGLIAFGQIALILLSQFDLLITAIGVIVGAFLGIHSGRAKAFQLKMQAQQALCQVQIEENTRK